MEVKLYTTEQTKELAYKIADGLEPGSVVALYGDLGAGKTAFTKYLCEQLGCKGTVQSPTFVLVRQYPVAEHAGIRVVNHIDLYRLQSVDEVNELGLEDMLALGPQVTVIEWPELVEKALPGHTIKIYFSVESDDSRHVKIQNLH